MQQQTRLSKLMYLSWEMQKKKKCTRSISLQSAWAMAQNEDITVYYLVKKHSHANYANKVENTNLTLFR